MSQYANEQPVQSPHQELPSQLAGDVVQEPAEEAFIETDEALSLKHKQQGNQHFKNSNFDNAIACYKLSLRYTKDAKTLCLLYSNIAITLMRTQRYIQAGNYCQKAIAMDNSHIKSLMNFAVCQEKMDKSEQALQAYRNVKKLLPDDAKISQKIVQLQAKVSTINQQKKEQVISGLKNIGNSILEYFGMSLDNFKLNKNDGGGYNVSFQQ